MNPDAQRKVSSRKTKLAYFSLKDQMVIVRYLYQQEVDSSEIHKLVTAACGELAPSYKDIREWVSDLVAGRDQPDMCVCDGGRKKSGMPSDATDPALVTRLEYLTTRDSRITLDRLSDLSIASVQTIQGIVHNLLGLKKINERWVPRIWTPEQRTYRVDVCQQLLDLYNREGVNLLSKIIIGDDSFVMYHKNQSPGNGGKYKPADESERVYCHFYYDMKGLLLADMQASNEPLSAEEYIDLIKDQLMPIVQRKRNNAGGPFYLLQSITSAHSSLDTLDALREMNIIVLPHAPASPDLEPFEFWLFRHLRKSMESLTFHTRAELWTTIKGHLHSLTDQDFGNSITKLTDRWGICIDKQGLYLL